MNLLYRNFYHAIAWSGIESFSYHALLLFHQIMLFHAVGSTAYGIVGTVFSFIYLSIALFNFGLDDSIAPFFSLSMSSKTNFRRLLLPQLIPELIILIAYSISIIIFGPYLIGSLRANIAQPSIIYIIGGIIVAEGIKKTTKMLLSLTFAYKQTAIVEVTTILLYIFMVWTAYWFAVPLTLIVLLAPMLFTSLTGSLIFAYKVYHLYKNLPESSPAPIATAVPWRIMKNRFFSYLTQLNHQFFSGNFLVPLFAVQFGFSQAGVLKLISHVVHTISTILNKTFGPAAFALLAHHKDMSLAQKRKAFYLATGYLHHALCFIFIFFFMNYKKLFLYSPHADLITPYWSLIILFIVIHFSEHFFMMYEKFYITEEKVEYIFVLNCFTTFLMYLILKQKVILAPSTILMSIVLIRLISFIIIHTVSFYLWELVPNFTIKPLYLFASGIFSALIFMLV